jgi:hypothetical protein
MRWSIGDICRVGTGKAEWVITAFWVDTETFAVLERVDARHVRMSAALDRLVAV